MRSSLRRCLSASLFGAVLAMGCRHADQTCQTCYLSGPPTEFTWPTTTRPAAPGGAAGPETEQRAEPAEQKNHPAQEGPVLPENSLPRPRLDRTQPLRPGNPVSPAPRKPGPRLPQPMPAAQPALPLGYRLPTNRLASRPTYEEAMRREVLQHRQDPIQRQPLAPPPEPGTRLVSAQRELPRYDHDSQYHWLVGTIDYSNIQGAWVVRYAPADQEDRFGGSVVLVHSTALTDFHSGQLVCVEGYVLDNRSEQIRPPYQVRKIVALEDR
jgi:hypothetical protein